jgi:hypothetical protein
MTCGKVVRVPQDDERSPAEQVSDDPFWSEVRRRHPDVDIVLLPPDEGPAQAPEGAEPVDPAEVARAGEQQVAALWTTLLGHVSPADRAVRWASGAVVDTLVRESTWTLRSAPEELAAQDVPLMLTRAGDALAAAGWEVLVPPGGVPRLTAGRPEGLGRSELLLLVVVDDGRVVLRFRTGPVLVADELRRELVGGDPA